MPIGSQEFDYHLDKQFFINMESSDVHGADLNVRLTVENRGEMYDLTFVITGEVTLICDRCLDNMQHEIDTTYHITVKYGAGYNDDSDTLLEIPESDNYLNVSYMIYDTVSLAIPIKHVHPMGKCNRAMSSLLKKHRATVPGDPDSELENELLDEMEAMPDNDSNTAPASEDTPTDPRWDKLKEI